MFLEMDDQKDFWIFDPKADRNDSSAFFLGAAFAVVLSLPSLRGWCCESAMIRPIIVRGRKYMVPEWTVAQLDRACGCRPAA